MRRARIGLFLVGSVMAGCQSQGTVEIGAVLPLTGPAQVYGEPIRKGLELALEELQASEGAPDIALKVLDSASEPAKAKALAASLYREGAWAVIGGVTTGEAKEMVPVADEYDRVLLSPSASSPDLTGISKNFYRVFPSDFLEGTKMGNFATQTLQLATAVILAAQSPYAVGIQQVFQAEFERHGGDVLEIVEFPENTSDFSGLLDRVMTLKPDCVYLAAYADEVAAMIRGLRGLEYPGTILTTSAFATAGVMSASGELATGVFLTQSAFEPRSEEPAVQAFVDAYQARYGAEPDIYAAHGYDALKVLATALADVALAGDVWKTLRSVRDFVGATGPIQFDERGDVGKFPRVYVIDRSGQLLNYEGEVARRREEILKRIRELQEERQEAAPPSGR